MTHPVRPALILLALVAAWEALARIGLWPRTLFPSPMEVGSFLLRSALDGSLASATLVTLRRLLLGYVAGLAVGLPLGLLT
ncbi:MAG: ABC transporter permease, partial [Planctomycetota bacterium]